jgi:hypothetical protein
LKRLENLLKTIKKQMSNRGKFLLRLLVVIVTIGIIILEISTEKRETIKRCEAVYIRSFYCVIENKEKIVKDHGTIKIYCKDIIADTTFIFHPMNVYEATKFFSMVNIGDTLKKQANSNRFWITNINKNDSITFNCNY